MDKNNDIKTSNVSKWESAPKNMGTLFTYIDLVIGMACSLPQEIHDNLYDLMGKTLDEYNELEARHQKDTGLISEYEEENKKLKSELDIKTDECDDLISRVLRQDIEYAKLEAEAKKLRENNELCMKAHLRLIDESTELATENTKLKEENDRLKDRCEELAFRSSKYTWAIKAILEKASYSHGHIAEEIRFMAKKSTTPKDVYERWEGIADELLGEHSKLVDKINRLEKENDELSSQVSSLKEKNDKLRVLPICGEIKWVLKEDDV